MSEAPRDIAGHKTKSLLLRDPPFWKGVDKTKSGQR